VRTSKPTVETFRKSILAYFAAHPNRPVLIGQIAVATGRSCEEAEGYLNDLASEGAIREVSDLEKRRHGIAFGYVRVARAA
jgi:hypothetical protein